MKVFVLLAFLSCFALPYVAGTRFVCYFPNWTFYRPGIYLKLVLLYFFSINIVFILEFKVMAISKWQILIHNCAPI